MKSKSIQLINIFLRYFFLLILALNPNIFYLIFVYPTKYLSYYFLNIFYETSLIGEILIFNGVTIEIIPSCIAPAAYLLLFILVFSIGPLGIASRIKLLVFSCFIFFFVNLFRIIFLILLYPSPYFFQIHFIIWHVLSTLFIIIIWFINIKLFKINKIPFYSDIKYFYLKIKK